MAVTYSGHGWLFLSTMAPLDIIIDGSSSQLIPINSPSRDVVYGSQVKEALFYPVTNEFVRKLAAAQNVQFRILGTKGSLEQCLRAESLKSIEAVIPLIP